MHVIARQRVCCWTRRLWGETAAEAPQSVLVKQLYRYMRIYVIGVRIASVMFA